VRAVFLGSGGFAIPSFEALMQAGHEVVALVTQPDKQKGRGRGVASPPLKPVAQSRGVPVLQPRRVREPAAQAAIAALRADIHVVVAYGQILPLSLVELPRHGSVNVHASLLPRYRGAAPIQWAIARGETETGVSTMRLDAGLDTGPVFLRRSLPIGPDETSGELEPRLAALGARLLLETLAGLEADALVPAAQDPADASLAPILHKEDGRLHWSQPAAELACRVRGFNPWPGGFTTWKDGRLAVWRARAVAASGPPEPGLIQGRDGDALLVSCASGSLALLEVQAEGRRRMSGAAFAAGARLEPAARFE